MIEFTLSRVTLCIGGMILLVAVVGAISDSYDTDIYGADGELADRIASMLDAFESSQMDTLILEGPRILPGERHISVHDNVVELYSDGLRHTALTEYSGEFAMDFTETVEITRRTSPRSS